MFYKDTSKDEMDPKKLAEDPTWFAGRITRMPYSMMAQVVFVILGEQNAYDTVLFFKQKEDTGAFLDLLKDAGLCVGDMREEELPDGTQVFLTIAKSRADVEKMHQVRALLKGEDRNGFDREYGKLMGFPETAIDAFEGEIPRYVGRGSSKEDWKNYYEKYDQSGNYGKFIYSKDHADEEHAYFLERNRKLKEYAPQLFK